MKNFTMIRSFEAEMSHFFQFFFYFKKRRFHLNGNVLYSLVTLETIYINFSLQVHEQNHTVHKFFLALIELVLPQKCFLGCSTHISWSLL